MPYDGLLDTKTRQTHTQITNTTQVNAIPLKKNLRIKKFSQFLVLWMTLLYNNIFDLKRSLC